VADARLVDARTYAAVRGGVAWHLTALFYEVAALGAAPLVTEIDGSTEAVAWMPLSDLMHDVLSPAAADAVRLVRQGRKGDPSGPAHASEHCQHCQDCQHRQPAAP